MSESLTQAINDMRTMRESYDQLAEAAEAYNEGKPALAESITAKGVEAAATDSLATMAEKVMTISQETIEIDGGEMYAKQLFGSLDTPNYWNLYDILAQLLSDGRLVNYGGILLAEYYKGYDSLALAGAGAGGAYVVSDKDSDGNFIMYTEDITHTWDDYTNGKGNRFVAYCFAEEYHNFDITDTNTSPRSIFIGRKVGTINCLVNARTTQVVVPDGNELVKYNSNGKTSSWNPSVTIVQTGDAGGLITQTNRIVSAYIKAGSLNGINSESVTNRLFTPSVAGGVDDSTLSCVIFEVDTITSSSRSRHPGLFGMYGNWSALGCVFIKGVHNCPGILYFGEGAQNPFTRTVFANMQSVVVTETEQLKLELKFADSSCCPKLKKLYFGYDTNDRSKGVQITDALGSKSVITDVEIQVGWCKPLNVSPLTSLTEENMVEHILNRLGDNTGQEALTITLGATNLAKLTEEEKAIATNKGFILA